MIKRYFGISFSIYIILRKDVMLECNKYNKHHSTAKIAVLKHINVTQRLMTHLMISFPEIGEP